MQRLIIVLLCFACTSQVKKEDSCFLELNTLERDFLGMNIKDVKVPGCYTLRDSLFESDEGVTWKALNVYKEQHIAFMLETSWLDSLHINRITVYDTSIRSESGISVGSSFKQIKKNVSSKLPSMPDGYFALRDGQNSTYLYMMNINKYPNLEYSIPSFKDIPADLKVECILVSKK